MRGLGRAFTVSAFPASGPPTTVSVGRGTPQSAVGARSPATDPRTPAGVVTVVLATLMALVAPAPVVAVVSGTSGPLAFTSDRRQPDCGDRGFEINMTTAYLTTAADTNQTRLITDGRNDQPGFSLARLPKCPRRHLRDLGAECRRLQPVDLTNNPAYERAVQYACTSI